MLSRIQNHAGKLCRALQELPVAKNISVSIVASTEDKNVCKTAAGAVEKKEERDTVNFPHPVRREHPGKVRYCLIPEEWFTRFYPITGVTGPYVFGVSVSSFLLSKEYYVLEHNYYNGLSMLALCVLSVKKLGGMVAAYADKEVDAIENQWNEMKREELRIYDEAIAMEKKAQFQAEGQALLADAKKKMVAVQLEAEYRQRQMDIHKEVVRRLESEAAASQVRQRVSLHHLAEWVRNQVREELSTDKELSRRVLAYCIQQLRSTLQTEGQNGSTAADPTAERVVEDEAVKAETGNRLSMLDVHDLNILV